MTDRDPFSRQRPETSPLPPEIESSRLVVNKAVPYRLSSPQKENTWFPTSPRESGITARDKFVGSGRVASAQRLVSQVTARVTIAPKDRWDNVHGNELHGDVLHNPPHQHQGHGHVHFASALSVPVRGPRSPSERGYPLGQPDSLEQESPGLVSPSSGPFGAPAGGSIKVNPALMYLLQ